MEHQIIKEKLQLYFFDELPAAERTVIEKHLQGCEECRKEISEMERLKVFLSLKKKAVSDSLLDEARQELRGRIRIERNRNTVNSRIKELITRLRNVRPAYVLGITAVFGIGLLLGFLLFKSNTHYINPIESPLTDEGTAPVKISDVKFIDSDPSDGQVEFTFNAIKPVRIKGNINDENIKSVLTYAMLNEENPGVRLNTVNLINESNSANIDPEVKAAVLAVAKYDDNPGVRKEALSFVNKIPFDEDVKSAYLYILMNDSVSGLRIEAINGLFEASKKGESFRPDELSIFKEKMHADDNSYIRLRAKTVLKEYN
jgi:hypothetical protein